MDSSKKRLFKRSRDPACRCRVIGIAGAGRGTGVTHLCVLAANYLASCLQHRTAVIEWNEHGGFGAMGRTFISRAGGRKEYSNHVYKILGVTYYMQGDPHILARCMDGSFDDIIIDFGEMRETIRAEWLRCTVKIVEAALSEWKLEAFLELLTGEEERGTGWIYTAAFGSEDTRRAIEKRFGISLVRVPLSEDAFSVDYKVMEWFERVL